MTCRTTKRSPERRQRVLISDKYTDAILDVNRKLDDISASLDAVTAQQNESWHAQVSGPGQPASLNFLKPRDTELSDFESRGKTSRGESSFESHAKRLKQALGISHGIQALPDLDDDDCDPLNQSSESGASTLEARGRPPIKVAAGGQSLPPAAITLSLLRLITSEQQPFFIDVPVITEDEFTEACQQVYFATRPYPIAAWATTNVGLYYLVHDLQPDHYSSIGVTTSTVETYLKILTQNIFNVVESLQLCTSLEFGTCQALALLGIFCLKSGYIETAWRLVTSALRMCVDLNMHRRNHMDLAQEMKGHSVFWWLYAIHQPLALTLGRPPSVRIADAETRPGQFGPKRHAGHFR